MYDIHKFTGNVSKYAEERSTVACVRAQEEQIH